MMTLHQMWPFVYATALFGLIGSLNFITPGDIQYSRLTDAFLSGNFELPPIPERNSADTAPFESRYYSALGPLPAVIFMPLVSAGIFHQGIVTLVASLFVFLLCFRLARTFHYSYEEACWFALSFCFATSFVGVAALATSNHLAHVFSVVFLFLAINEYEEKSRFPLVGGLVGLAMATRLPTGLNIFSFVLLICFGVGTGQKKLASLVKLLVPFGLIAAILAVYNFARFGNPLESGYSFQVNGFGIPYSMWDVPGNKAGPLLSISNIPNHLWIFLAGLPSFRGIGTSVLLVSPFLVYLLKLPRWDLTNQLIAIAILPVLLVDLAFRSTGFEQMGYRFSLDFFPFLFWLLMRSRIALTGPFKGLILLATMTDLVLTFYHMATASVRRELDVAFFISASF
jgi:hypothetical protein